MGGSSPTAPPGRDFEAETSAILKQQKASSKNQQDLVKSLLDLYPQFAAAERAATTAQRKQNVTDLDDIGPGFMESFRDLSPSYAVGEDALTAELFAGNRTSALLDKVNEDALAAGPSQIRSELERQALSDLGLGRSLSPEEIRDSEQGARAAYSARGMAMSNPAIAAEILNRDAAARAREAERRAFAGSVSSLGQSEDQANRNFQTSVQSANEASLGNWRNFVGQGVQIGGNSPVLGLLDQRASVPVTAPGGMLAQASQASAPLWSYGSDLFNTNFNSSAAANIAGQNKPSPWASAGAGAASGASLGTAVYPGIGTAIGAVAGGVGGYFMCWVAREIFGEDDMRWAWFRLWLEREAPAWFCALYFRYGRMAAAVLRLPWIGRRLKTRLTPWFEARARAMQCGHDAADRRRVRAIFNEYQLTKELPLVVGLNRNRT